MPRLDFILFCDHTTKDGGIASIHGVMTMMQRIEPVRGVRHEVNHLGGYYRVSGCEPMSEVNLRVVAYRSDGFTRASDPADPHKAVTTNAAGFAFGQLRFEHVLYDLNGLHFAVEQDGVELGREFLPVSPIY